jgi:hypothetical protein
MVSRRLMRTLPNIACSMPIPPSRASVPCSLLCPLQLTATVNEDFIHYQLICFCQATRLQYLNGHVQLANQHVVQQQHVDHKIANALLKKGTCDAYKA